MMRYLLIALCLLIFQNPGPSLTGATSSASPSSPVAGMTVWYSADCITLSGSVCSTPGSTTNLSTWSDRSGNGNNLSSASGACQWSASQINSLPAVLFNGTCRLNMGINIPATAGHTVFVVYQDLATDGYILGSTHLDGFSYVPPGSASGEVAAVVGQNLRVYGAGTNQVVSGTWHQSNALMINYTSGPGFTVNLRLDEAVDPTSSTTSGDMQGDGPTGVGGNFYGGFSQQYFGRVAEVIYYNSNLTSYQILQNEQYLKGKYGI